jgi:glycosyltransferase involved in cell wall biosynthesis
MRVLLILTDGYGCPGGIARVNLDLIDSFCADTSVSKVVALARRTHARPEPINPKLDYDERASRGNLCFVTSLLRRVLVEGRYDLVVCTHLHLQPVAWLSARLCGAPSVLFFHGIEAWAVPRQALRRLAAKGADWYVAATALTLDRARRWLTIPDTRRIVAPFGVDLTRYVPGTVSAEVLEKYRLRDTVVLLSLGRLASGERYKGYDEILGILGRLRIAEPRLVYVIAGDGDDRSRLEAKARDLGIAAYVRFTGYVSEAEKLELYRAARAFVLAGWGEGFGLVLLEALACGVPVVASTLDGSFEAIKEGALGVAVDPHDPDALCAGILEALRRPSGQRLPGLGYFSREAFSHRIHDLIARIAGETYGRSVPQT